MTQRPEWWEWVDLNTKVSEPLKLKDDPPEEMKEKFEEWKRKEAENKSAVPSGLPSKKSGNVTTFCNSLYYKELQNEKPLNR